MTCALVLFVCLGTPAGYVASRYYNSLESFILPFIKEKCRLWLFHNSFKHASLLIFALEKDFNFADLCKCL